MKNIMIMSLILSLSTLIGSCVGTTSPTAAQPIKESTPVNKTQIDISINENDQAIYSMFMGDANGKIIVIREDTSTDTFPQNEEEARNYIKSNLSDISSETLDNYLYINSVPSKLPKNMNLGTEYILISTPDFLEITSSSEWQDAWSKKYPDSDVGCIAFSRIGFDDTHTQALVYVSRLWVDGGYYLLEFDSQKGNWVVVENFTNVIIN